MKNPFTILNGIIFTIVFSVIGLIALIVFSSNIDFGLVEKDYYEKGINYQQKIDSMNRSNDLSEPVRIENLGKVVKIAFPNNISFENVTGQIQMFRPSDPSMDKYLSLKLDSNGVHLINIKSLEKGAWMVKLNWSYEDLNYYIEQRIFLNK